MKKILQLLAITGLLCLTISPLHAQVTVGSNIKPVDGALLDLKELQTDGTYNTNKGMVFPRVELTDKNQLFPMFQANGTDYKIVTNGVTTNYTKAHEDKTHTGLVVYNTKDASPFKKGLYIWDGTQWAAIQLSTPASNWFYMPSVPFDTSTDLTGQPKDLYALYKAQFETPLVRSAMGTPDEAPEHIPYVPEPDQLYYYITYADPAVFQNITITKDGKMTYDVKAVATEATYINIVFVLK